MSGERILVVDDEPGVREALRAILRDEGFDVATAASGEEGLEALRSASFDAVLLDVWLPGIDGIETLIQIREKRLEAPVVMISGHGTIETAVRATKLGAFDFVEKPLSLERILLVLRNALRQQELERRTERLLEQLARDTEIVGRSAAAARLRSEVVAASGSSAPVLICGEPGSGRATVARRIHGASARSGQAYVEFPCGALDGVAAAEALFGNEGSPGRIGLAAAGSLFLEEVDRLDASVQVRLAGMLGERERSGSVRLLASATADLSGLEPSLRGRLDVIRIGVPPLRERREDIPILAERFLRELAQEYGRGVKRLAPATLSALTAHAWPRNVRELRNLVERVVLLVPGDVVEVSDLPEEFGGSRAPSQDLYRVFDSLAEGVEAFERYFVRRILTEERGNLASASRRLGVDPKHLAARIKALGL